MATAIDRERYGGVSEVPDDSAVAVSVVICTFNRADVLAETLESYGEMVRASVTRGELIVVDNNSTDGTAQIVQDFMAGRRDLRFLSEAVQGLSYARNAGVRAARGEIIAFADDDVYFDRGWVDAVAKAFAMRREADCLGGRTIPLFAAGSPTWLHESELYMYGATDSGDSECWMEYPKHPFGVNMAFRRRVFERIGVFDPRLGRVGGTLLSGEETDLFRRVHLAGFRTLYVPSAVLHHRIAPSRATPDWVLERSYWQGVTEVVLRQLYDPMSRFALLRLALRDLRWLVRHHAGGHLQPRAIYWHHRGLPLHARAWSKLRRGRIRQALKEVFTRSTLACTGKGSWFVASIR